MGAGNHPPEMVTSDMGSLGEHATVAHSKQRKLKAGVWGTATSPNEGPVSNKLYPPY